MRKGLETIINLRQHFPALSVLSLWRENLGYRAREKSDSEKSNLWEKQQLGRFVLCDVSSVQNPLLHSGSNLCRAKMVRRKREGELREMRELCSLKGMDQLLRDQEVVGQQDKWMALQRLGKARQEFKGSGRRVWYCQNPPQHGSHERNSNPLHSH